ncbi:unnamed protein product [Linum trigynum]|uniref:Condensin-2 complex subunit H2 n=1 Tax=Linum trigynum TaxID=586398 RepID=A0AAV2GV94_9ROSI
MSNHNDGSGERIHTVQAERDLEANWEVDLAKKLEDYLLKICSGEIRGTEEDAAHISINFAEAALLLQGSVQVYSRKVEYLYNLVIHALDFLSEKRQQGQSDDASAEQPEKTASRSANYNEDDEFWGSDDIPVEPRNCLEASTSKDASFYHFTKPPANLVVLEGDCLDTGGDGGELESYLLATSDLYRDFILLDPCDAPSVNDFLDDINIGHGPTYKPSSVRKTGHSSAKRSRRSSLGKSHDAAFNRSPIPDCGLQDNNSDVGPGPSKEGNFGAGDQGFDMDDMYSPPGNLDGDSDLDDEETDPWKPLNPHEPGDLKVKPFKRVALRKNMRNSTNTLRQASIAKLFPLAKLHCPISTEFKEMWEVRQKTRDQLGNSQSQSNPLYEKLRESLAGGGKKTGNFSDNGESDNWDNDDDNGDPGFDQPYGEMPEATFMDDDLPHQHNKNFDGATGFDNGDCFEQGEPSSQASLEDLCRSHLDALLANIAESEKQTELAARVSSWKQKIEHNLEVQDSRPPFDIHVYGKRILDKLSLESETETIKSFADIVTGQEGHDVARSFSAMLQLVNDGDIDLEKNAAANGKSFCYTAVNPFHVKLLKRDGRQAQKHFKFSKKRVKSPLMKARNKEGEKKLSIDRSSTPKSQLENGSPSLTNSKFTSKLQMNSSRRCTPEGKRRRRSRLVEPIDLPFPV